MRRQRATMGLIRLSAFLSSLLFGRAGLSLSGCAFSSASHRKATRGPGSTQRRDATLSNKSQRTNAEKRAAAPPPPPTSNSIG